MPSRQAATASRLPFRRAPSPVSRRQLVLWSAGLLCVVLGVLGAVGLSRAGDERTRVLVVSHDLPAGAPLTDADLAEVSIVADGSLSVVPARQRGALVGRFLRVRLLSGQLISAGFVQDRPVVTPGK